MAEDSTPHHPNSSRTDRIRLWLRNFLPAPTRVGGKELLRMVVVVAALLALTGLVSRGWGQPHHIPWLFASMGASALLLISTPSSPMAQPWPVVGGSVLSGLSGAVAALLFQDPNVAAAVAVGLSVMVMMVMRCLHPPGAALAMWIALERSHGFDILLYPVGLNLVLMVALATVLNRMTGKRYPAPQHTQKVAAPRPAGAQIDASDLDVALSRFNGVLDVSRADLESLMHLASQAAFKRTLGNLRCEDIMAHPVQAAQADTPVKEAWERMRTHRIKSLPVVDAAQQVIGIVTATDLLGHTLDAPPEGITGRLKSMVLRKKKPEAMVGEWMTRDVTTVQALDRVVGLIDVFSTSRLRHVPVVNAHAKLVGIVTQRDLIRAMAHALTPNEEA